jgi:hypothetical protein
VEAKVSDDQSWISTGELAAAAGVTPQAIRKMLASARKGVSWRGRQVAVRPALTRGGRGGVGYEVAIGSLPAAIQAKVVSPAAEDLPSGALARRGDDQRALTRWELVAKALEHRKSSRERSDAVAAIADLQGISPRTLYRWISQYEDRGVRGLARAQASNAGDRRVWISREFDRAFGAAGYSAPLLADLAADLERKLKGLWASRAEQAGSTEIRRLGEFLLVELCEAHRVRLPPDAIKLSRRCVERFAHYRVVNQRKNDRKGFDDAKPRIRRDWTGLAPMERIVADVKHLDVIVQRSDGSRAWPKIVAFLDAGTGRVFVHPVLLDRGEGVRQEHVIEAFLAMVATPNWGFPQGLYLDNGSEFGALTKIDSALQLLNETGARTVIFARPYNASAKPIESLFARLDRYVFSLLPGYAGPNRMAQKTQTVGKPPAAYAEGWEAFCETVAGLIKAHNHRPVGGGWNGRSPEAWFAEKAEAGWRPATVRTNTLDAAFADHDSRRIDRGVLKIAGKRYTHPYVAHMPSRSVIDIALPWRRGAAPLARTASGWVHLTAEVRYPARWIEGAEETTRRQRAQNRYVSDLAKDASVVDPVATKLRWGERQEAQVVLPRTAKLDLGDELRALGEAPPRPEAPVDPSAKWRREMEITERLEKANRHDG